MVGQDAQRDVRGGISSVPGAENGGRRIDEWHEQVGIEDGIDTLEDGQVPLQAGACVDVLPRQVGEGARGIAVELHEHEIPDFDEAVAAAVLRAALVAVGRTEIHEDLGIGAAGPGLAHGPEVVGVAHALDPLGAKADLVDPDLLGLVVVVVDRDPETVTVVAQDLGQQLPGHGDGVGLEIVTEAEVAEHLEEGAVIRVGPDDLDVRGPEALLNGGGPGPRCRLLAQKVRLERHHAGDREEDRGIVGNQAGGGDDTVAPVREEAREGRPQSVGVHLCSLPGAKTDPGPPRGPLRPRTSPRSACSAGCRRSTRRRACSRR